MTNEAKSRSDNYERPDCPTWDAINECSRNYGDAFFSFDQERLSDNYQCLWRAFARYYPNTNIAYSYKTNYTPRVCLAINQLGGWAEVVSEMEYDLATRLGVRGDRIIYNGPYKSVKSVRAAVRNNSILNLDSIRDLRSLEIAAKESPNSQVKVGLRCNFDLGKQRSRFGFDVGGAEFNTVTAAVRRLPGVSLSGLHCHLPSRGIDSFLARTGAILRVADAVFPGEPEFLDIGGGFFGRMPESLRATFPTLPPSFEEYGQAVGEMFAKRFGVSEGTPTLYIEPGTALVSDAFRFYARVLNTKEIRGQHIATVAGSIFNISPNARSARLPVRVIAPHRQGGAGAHLYDVAGYTCIESDYLSRGLFTEMSEGDFLEYRNVGSYSIVMKPPFILPNVPIVSFRKGGGVEVVRQAETWSSIFASFTQDRKAISLPPKEDRVWGGR